MGGGSITASVANASATYADAETTPAASITLTVGGTLTDGELWTLTVSDGTPTDYAANARKRHAATTEGRTLVVVDFVGPFAAPAFKVASAVLPPDFLDDARFAASGVDLTLAAVTLPAGALGADISYTLLLRIGEVAAQFGYVTVAGDTPENVLQALAAAVNVNAQEDFTAFADGRTLFVVNRAGTGFSIANEAANAAGGEAAVVNLTAATLFAGEVWTVFLDDSTFATTHVHVVSQGETLADVARELANSIVTSGVVTFTAVADGNRVVIVNLADQAFDASVEVTPAGQVSIVETRKFNTPVAGNHYFYRPVNLNTRVDEAEQVDTMNVYNNGSPADDVGVLTADHLTGLGMGGDTVIAGRTLPGGIVYRDLEVLSIRLGSGNDDFTVVSTHAGATNISAGAGNDDITVQSIDGHTRVDAGDGDDEIWVGSDAAPNLPTPNLLGTVRVLLTVIGGAGNDTLYVDDSAETDDGTGILTGSTITGLGMPSVSEVQTIHVQAAAGVYTLRIADETIDSTTATTTMVELSGTPISTDRWRIVIDGDIAHAYTVTVGGAVDTVEEIAAALAALIDADTARGFTAAADGAILLIVNPSGEGFQAVFEIDTIADAPTAAVEEIQGATTTAVLTGTLNGGDVWNFTVGGQVFTLPAVVAGSTTFAQMASNLAAQINAFAGLPDYLAIAVGDTLVVMDRGSAPTRPTIALSIALAGAAGTGSSVTVDDAVSSVALSLAGTPVLGEVWSVPLTVGSVTTTVSTTVVLVDADGEVSTPELRLQTVAEIAASLATAITTSGPANFSATAEGNTLVIVDRSGAAFPAGLAVQVGNPGPATVPAGPVAAGTSLPVTLQGAVIAGEKWVLDLAAGTGVASVTSVSYTVKAGDTLASIAAGLDAALAASTDPVAAQFAATVDAGTPTVLRLSNASAESSASVTVLPAAAISTTRQDAASATFDLAGTPKANDRWIVTVNGTQYSVAVGATSVLAGGVPITIAGGAASTLAQLAAALAQAINATLPDSFTAFVDGSTLIVTERAGVAFGATGMVALATPTGGTVSASATGRAVVAGLNGDPATDETWRLTIDGADYEIVVGDSFTAGSQTFVVDTREEIALALATKVNADLLNVNIIATQVGDTVVLASRDGADFTAAVEIELAAPAPAGSLAGSASVVQTDSATATLSGTPQPGETWTIRLNGTGSVAGTDLVAVTYGDPVDGVTVTLAEFAAALAFKVNDELTGFVAVGACESECPAHRLHRRHAGRRHRHRHPPGRRGQRQPAGGAGARCEGADADRRADQPLDLERDGGRLRRLGRRRHRDRDDRRPAECRRHDRRDRAEVRRTDQRQPGRHPRRRGDRRAGGDRQARRHRPARGRRAHHLERRRPGRRHRDGHVQSGERFLEAGVRRRPGRGRGLDDCRRHAERVVHRGRGHEPGRRRRGPGGAGERGERLLGLRRADVCQRSAAPRWSWRKTARTWRCRR